MNNATRRSFLKIMGGAMAAGGSAIVLANHGFSSNINNRFDRVGMALTHAIEKRSEDWDDNAQRVDAILAVAKDARFDSTKVEDALFLISAIRLCLYNYQINCCYTKMKHYRWFVGEFGAVLMGYKDLKGHRLFVAKHVGKMLRDNEATLSVMTGYIPALPGKKAFSHL